MDNHQSQWNTIQNAWANQRIPQSMLFVGPLHCNLADFITRVIQLISCEKQQNLPCLVCNNCQMVQRSEYPDVQWVKPEKSGSAVKIDQIRELQSSAYLTPQRGRYRVIVIEPADRMNTAAANALLKILEEPAQHTIFILLAQQLSTVLPTILSRCQIIKFSSLIDLNDNALILAEYYPEDSQEAKIVSQAETILNGVIDLIEGRLHPCGLAAQWVQFELSILLWFFFLVFSQLQNTHFYKKPESGPAQEQLVRLSALLNPVKIFTQIDKISTLLKKLSHNMNINNTLVLEDLLFSLVADS